MAALGKREIGLIEDALKDIYEQLTGDAVGFRKGILSNLIQGDNGANYVTHTNALFDAFRKIEPVFEDLLLEKAIDFVKTSYDVLVETDQIADIDIPEMMWTGYDETANALEDIAIALNEKYDFDIDTTNIDNILVDMSEQLMGSDLKVGDIPEALEIQIRILDEMQYHEISQMYTAWTSTEQMRPMTVQLVEIYDQIDNLSTDDIDNLFTEFKDDLWITNEPNEYLLKYDNPEGLKTKSVKNMIKYYFEQVGRLQEGYINFNGAEHAFLDGFEISNQLDRPLLLDDNLKLVTRDNMGILLPNSKEPYQLLHSITDFQGVSSDIPFQVSIDYFTRYQEIIGKTISDNFSDADYARTEFGINQEMSLGEFAYEWNITDISDLDTSAYDAIPTNVVDEINKIGTLDYPNQWHNTPTVKLVEAISKNNLDIFVKNSKGEFVKLELDDTARIGENAIQNSPKFEIGKSAIYNAIEELGDVDNPKYKLDLYSSNPDELAKLENALSNVNFDPFVNPEGTPFELISDTPTNVVDELDDAISKADGIDNLNKAKDIINKNPGVFRKIFSVLEKADIGDQVITKAIIPKVLPRIGLAAATGPVGMAYAAYEIALLLSDVGQAAYKAQTTDESFWDNFGEVSDKYSIAYKIGKPVYDIILDNLNNDLTEEEDEEILFSFNR